MALVSKVLQAIFEAALPILVSALAAWLIAKTREIFAHLKSTNPELYYMVDQISRCSVNAAEQLYKGSLRGPEKKEYAMEVVESFLKSKNLDIDVKVIEAYVEAAVRDMNRYRIDTPEPSNDNVQATVQE